MKKTFITVFLLSGFALFAPDVFKDESLEALRIEQEKIAAKMHALRVELLEKDKNLNRLHNRIVLLQRELSIKLDSNRKMRELNKKMAAITARIEVKESKNTNRK